MTPEPEDDLAAVERLREQVRAQLEPLVDQADALGDLADRLRAFEDDTGWPASLTALRRRAEHAGEESRAAWLALTRRALGA